LSQAIEFIESQVEIEHRQDALELIFGNFSFSQFVEIIEKFFNSNSLHDDVMLKSVLNVTWAV